MFCAAWSIVGFPLLAGITANLGLPSTEFSIVFRGLAAGAAATLLLAGTLQKNKIAVTLFLIFWCLYFLRLSLSTLLGFENLRRPNEIYWIWAFGTCFLPTLAVLTQSNTVILDKLYSLLLTLSLIAVVLSLLEADTIGTSQSGNMYDINRLNLTSLNPIAMGHLGVTTALLGICGLISRELIDRHLWVAISAIGLGLTTAFLANSRGPLLAMALCILLLILGGMRQRRIYLLVSILFCAALFAYFSQLSVLFSYEGVISRFLAISSGDDATIGRLIAYQGALDQFLSSPVFGDAIEERITRFYPHNVVLEAFMSTGVVGGIPFIAFTFWALLCAWRLVRSGSRYLWVGVLASQYFLGALFSGAIYSSNTMWVLLALAICSRFKERPKNELSQGGCA